MDFELPACPGIHEGTPKARASTMLALFRLDEQLYPHEHWRWASLWKRSTQYGQGIRQEQIDSLWRIGQNSVSTVAVYLGLHSPSNGTKPHKPGNAFRSCSLHAQTLRSPTPSYVTSLPTRG